MKFKKISKVDKEYNFLPIIKYHWFIRQFG